VLGSRARDLKTGGSQFVVDTGIGIAPSFLKELFQEFTQPHRYEAKYGGIGLGFAMSRRLCRLKKGHIAVETSPGTGSTFTVRLPAADARS